MNTIQPTEQDVNKIYEYAANLMVNEKKSVLETRRELVNQGIDAESAATIVSNLHEHIQIAQNKRANKDMIFGALWLVGGIVATAAQVGFIFWGAIVFGAIQFFKGLINKFPN